MTKFIRSSSKFTPVHYNGVKIGGWEGWGVKTVPINIQLFSALSQLIKPGGFFRFRGHKSFANKKSQRKFSSDFSKGLRAGVERGGGERR